MKPAVILDCDPGDDDAIALLLAGRRADLVGVTTVSGNAPLAATTRNALAVLELLGLDVPVHSGADRPLVAEAETAADIHGPTGLDGPELPAPAREPDGDDAAGYLIATAHPDLTLVATGPLTNVALAIRRAPQAMARLKAISVMGGSAGFGNRTPAAEFNILQDPEAADIVFRSGIPIRMAGLNLTHQVVADAAFIEAARGLGNRAGRFVADLLAFSSRTYAEVYSGRAERPLHDPCALLAVTDPGLFRFEPRHVAVELSGWLTRGMTVVDERDRKTRTPPNAEVGYGADAPAVLRLITEMIATY